MDNNSDGRNDIKTHARVIGLTEFSSKWWDNANIFTKKKHKCHAPTHSHNYTVVFFIVAPCILIEMFMFTN